MPTRMQRLSAAARKAARTRKRLDQLIPARVARRRWGKCDVKRPVKPSAEAAPTARRLV